MPPKVGGAMEKVLAGKGGRKSRKKKKEEPKQEDPNFVTEVDKTFYELQITDLNRKLARLRSLVQELEEKNEELTTTNTQIEEDRADVIAYLKRTLAEKENELRDQQERLKAMNEVRQEETQKYEEQIKELEFEFKTMQEQLNSEIKLLQGKLNSLEEFRIQRDELMKKYEEQEKAMEEQEVKHKREIYEIERKFIIGKDKLKKEMEARLLQLSTDFQDATEVRIASTTHRVIRENIAINNELDLLLETQQRLQTENEHLKQKNKVYRLETELHEVEKRKAVHKSKVQAQLIEKLTHEHGLMVLQLNTLKRIEEDNRMFENEAAARKKELETKMLRVRILEQNLQTTRGEVMKLRSNLGFYTYEYDRLTVVLCTAVKSIKAAMEIKDEPTDDEAVIVSRRENLLNDLLNVLTMAEEQKLKHPELESVDSLNSMYMRGDLGFVPKKSDLKHGYDIRKAVPSQVGGSFEDFLRRNKAARKSDEEGSDAELRIISDPDMLRLLLKERAMQKELEAREAMEEEEEVLSMTYFDIIELSEGESNEGAVDPTQLELNIGGDFGYEAGGEDDEGEEEEEGMPEEA